jgi:hypothetical protein
LLRAGRSDAEDCVISATRVAPIARGAPPPINRRR